jgi:hypothetical protein
MDNDLSRQVAMLQQQMAVLQSEITALKKLLGLDPRTPVHELPAGARLSPRCEMVWIAAPDEESWSILGASEEGAYLSLCTKAGESLCLMAGAAGGEIFLRDAEQNPRIYAGVEEGEPCVALQAKDGGNRVEMFIKDDGGQVCVRTTGQKPRAGIKALAAGGVVSIVDDKGEPQAALVGRDLGGELLVLDQQKEICARISSLPEGGLISAQRGGQPIVSLASMKDGGLILVHGSEGKLAVGIGDTGHGGHVRVHDAEGRDRASLMVVNDTAWVTVCNKDGQHVCAMNNLNEAGYLEICNAAGQPGISMDADEFPRFAMRDNEKRPVVLLTSDEQGGMIVVNDNAGQLAAVVDVDGSLDKPAGRIGVAGAGASLRSVLSVDAEGQGIASVFGANGEQRAAMFAQKDGGTFHSFGPENTALAVFGGTEHGGALTINNDLGISRAAICVHKDGGQLQLHWAGTPVATLSAQEQCGMLYLSDSDGEIRTRLPEDEPPWET